MAQTKPRKPISNSVYNLNLRFPSPHPLSLPPSYLSPSQHRCQLPFLSSLLIRCRSFLSLPPLLPPLLPQRRRGILRQGAATTPTSSAAIKARGRAPPLHRAPAPREQQACLGRREPARLRRPWRRQRWSEERNRLRLRILERGADPTTTVVDPATTALDAAGGGGVAPRMGSSGPRWAQWARRRVLVFYSD